MNSLGIGGTNAHLILEEAPQTPAPANRADEPIHLLALSARTESALRELVQRYMRTLAADSHSLGDICHTANLGRSHFEHRLAVVAGSPQEARKALKAFLAGSVSGNLLSAEVDEDPPSDVHRLLAEVADRRGQPESRQTLRSLGLWYVQGTDVDWSELLRESRQRVHLPTYPFQRKRYWIERPEGPGRKAAAWRRGGKSHPLLGVQLKSPALRDVVFESTIDTASFPLLDDHRFLGVPILPGACQLAMVVDAAGDSGKTTACMLEDVSFARAMVVADGNRHRMQLIISGESKLQGSFEVVSRDAGRPEQADEVSWTTNAGGRLVPYQSPKLPPELPLRAELRKRFMDGASRRLSSQQFYRNMHLHGAELGDSLRIIDSVWLRENEVLCRLRMPEQLDGFDAYRVHPVLLDACIQVIGGVFEEQDGYDPQSTLMPTAVKRFRFMKPATGDEAWCYLRIINAGDSAERRLTVDAALFESGGRIIATFDGLGYEQVPREVLSHVVGSSFSQCVFQTNWVAQSREPRGRPRFESRPGVWLIFNDANGIGDRLASRLQEQGQKCILVEAGDRYQSIDTGRYEIDPCDPAHFRRLIEDARGTESLPPRGMVYLWSLDASRSLEDGSFDLGRDRALACAGVLHLLQAVSELDSLEAPLVCLATQGAQAVDTQQSPIRAQQSPLWGLARTAALEHPQLQCVCVDLDPNSGAEQESLLLEELWTEAENGDREVAFRGGSRFLPRLVEQHLQRSQWDSISASATYLVTGGTGGLGREVACWLIGRGARHLAIISRQGDSSAPAREAVESWRRQGVEVALYRADVSQRDDMTRVFDQLQADMPAIKGIVHAAGILDDGVLKHQSWTRFRHVLAAKMDGALNLHLLTRGLQLDFFVAFSSIASQLGSAGQATYAAANAFLDTLMQHRRAAGLPGLSINWGPWAKVGMVTRLNWADRRNLARRGLEPLAPSVAIDAMSALLAQGVTQASVVKADWPKYLSQGGDSKRAFLSELAASATEPASRPQSELQNRLLGEPPGKRRQMLLDFVRGVVADILGVESEGTVKPDQGFYDLGMDSLSVVVLRNRLQSDLSVALPVTLAFQHTTVRALADFLTEELSPAGEVSATNSADDEPQAGIATGETTDDVPKAASGLDDLSQDELVDRLAEKLARLKRSHGDT